MNIARISMLMLAAAMASCQTADKPVPRREAYPRIELYAPRYGLIGADTIPIDIWANQGANVKYEQRGHDAWWIDIAYPRYRSHMYVTLLSVHPDEIDDAIANRLERIQRDMGDANAHVRQWKCADWEGITAYAPWVLSTPVAMVAHNDKWIMYATAFCQGYADADQLAPVAESLDEDIINLLFPE